MVHPKLSKSLVKAAQSREATRSEIESAFVVMPYSFPVFVRTTVAITSGILVDNGPPPGIVCDKARAFPFVTGFVIILMLRMYHYPPLQKLWSCF
jgi:hypothetical protein